MARSVLAGPVVDQGDRALSRGEAGKVWQAAQELRRLYGKTAQPLLTEWSRRLVQQANATYLLVQEKPSGRFPQMAEETYQKYKISLQLDPAVAEGDRELLNSIGYFFADQGRNKEDFQVAERFTRRSLQLYETALAGAAGSEQRSSLLFAQAVGPRDSLAWALYRLRRFPEALAQQTQAVTQARELQPVVGGELSGLAELYYHLGEIHRALRQPDEARRAFAEALDLKPDHAAALSALDRLPPASVRPLKPARPLPNSLQV